MKYCRSFKDDYYVYLLLEHVRGIELFDVLRGIGLVSRPLARFYISNLIIAIEYLHSNNIIYRDLKPENVMVESTGYLRLIDMGTAKRLLASKGFRTFTMIGTPHYMGPEVLQSKGYSFTTDLWSIGVMLYEFLCGELPYAENLDDPYDIYYEVMKNTIKFPSSLNDIKAIRLIEQLMNKTPENRLGRSFAALKNNPYFEETDWEAVYQKKVDPPYFSEHCKREQEKIKKLTEGKPLLEEIAKERKGLKRIPVSKWDTEF
jgi:cGMP-dependent protein kinase